MQSRTLNALPPWAKELEKNIESQAICAIAHIKKSENDATMEIHVKVKRYLSKKKSMVRQEKHELKIIAIDENLQERVKRLISGDSFTTKSEYIISFRSVSKNNIEWIELTTIDFVQNG